jgi:SulP family sulfate permease
MAVTLAGTLFLDIEFAVLLGIMLSLALYIMRTSVPRVQAVVPDDQFRHFVYEPDKDQCPQLGIIDIYGDLYFGAVNHVEEFILDYGRKHPDQRFLLIRMNKVNHIDFSGIHMLESIVRSFRDRGGDVYLVRVNYRVRDVMKTTNFDAHLGLDHFVTDDENAFSRNARTCLNVRI